MLGAGGVRSVPAFALGSPTLTAPLSVTVQGVDSPMSVVLQSGLASCPGSAVACDGCVAGAATNMSLQVTASVLSPDASVARWGWGSDALTAFSGGNEFTSTPVTKTVDPVAGGTLQFVKIRASGSDSLRPPDAGDALLIVARAVYRCTHPNGDTSQLTETQEWVFTFDGTVWQKSLPLG